MSKPFTPQHALEHLEKDAKRWLKALRAGDENARSRFRRALQDPPDSPTLRDVQHAFARELGHSGRSALTESLASMLPAPGSHAALIDRFLDNACPDRHVRGLQDHLRARHTAMRLLDQNPEIAAESFPAAIACGDIATVFLATNPALATSKTPGSPYRAMVGGSGDLFQALGPKGWAALRVVQSLDRHLPHPPPRGYYLP